MLRRTAIISLTLALYFAPAPSSARERPDEPLIPTVREAASPEEGRCATPTGEQPQIPPVGRSLMQHRGRLAAGA